MTDHDKPAFLVVCGRANGKPMDPEYARRATPVALSNGLKPIGGGELGVQVEVLEGSLPEGTNFMAIEQFPSMNALKAFYFSEAYQSAIPFRESVAEIHFIAALDGISDAELKARAEAAAQAAAD
ncbi:MAG: DUF1330 domain-containing protein [Pseudomonadota bacterium]